MTTTDDFSDYFEFEDSSCATVTIVDGDSAQADIKWKRRITFESAGTTRHTVRDRLREESQVEKFLEKVYLLVHCNETRLAIDEVFQYFTDLIQNEKYKTCDAIMRAVDIDLLDSTLMVAFLSITLPVREKLWTRPLLFRRVLSKLASDRGHDKASRLLTKYR